MFGNRTTNRLCVIAMLTLASACGKEGSEMAEIEMSGLGPFESLSLSGPYTCKNLSVVLVHGDDRFDASEYLTLSEGLSQDLVFVHETGVVGEIEVENRSNDRFLFLHAGDIVKGGKQDRILAFDRIVPPHSGRVPLRSFCVERGRWSPRTVEMPMIFRCRAGMASSRELKLAIRDRLSQEDAWDEVEEVQEHLTFFAGEDVRSEESRTSLALTLESGVVKEATGEYVNALSRIFGDREDVVGFVFSINGVPNSAEIYGSGALFRRLWPDLLEAAAVEATASPIEDATRTDGFSVERAMAFLTEASRGIESEEDSDAPLRLRKISAKESLCFETSHVRDGRVRWLHRSVIARDGEGE